MSYNPYPVPTDITPALEKKLIRANYYLEKLRAAWTAGDMGACEHEFASCITAIRSVSLLVRSWLEKEGVIKRRSDSDWSSRISPWLAKLTKDEIEAWDCIRLLRNADIHEECIVPESKSGGGHFGSNHFASSWFASPFFGRIKYLAIEHPKTRKWVPIIGLCENGIAASKRLSVEYFTLK